MPSVNITIPQREITISRSAIREVVKDFIVQTGFPTNAELVFNEKQGAVKNKGGRYHMCESDVKTDYNNYVFITDTEEYLESGRNNDNNLTPEHRMLFKDSEIGVSVKPHYAKVMVSLSLKFRSRDLTTLNSWRAALKFSSTNGPLMKRHDVLYDYNIPDEISYFIHTAYQMREAEYGNGETYREYIKRNFKKGIGVRRNASGTAAVAICEETQTGVTGIMETSMAFNTVEIDNGIYEIEIPYKFYYEQPIALQLNYPVIIYNKFISKKMLVAYKDNYSGHRKKLGSNPLSNIDDGINDRHLIYRGDGGTRLVDIDDWFPINSRPNTQTVCIFPYQVDTTKPTDVANLNDLKGKYIPEEIIDYLDKYNSLKAEYKISVVLIEIFETDNVERSLQFTLDQNLQLNTLAPLEPKRRNYVRISVHKDWSIIPDIELKPLMKDPELLFKLAKIIDPKLEMHTIKRDQEIPKGNNLVNEGGLITVLSLSKWLRNLQYVNKAFKNAKSRMRASVLSLNPIIRRGE